jgi:ABC-type branched-subunit amino acid transport system ATPase component
MALHRQGMTILMVEQNARRARDLLEDAGVRKAYLG